MPQPCLSWLREPNCVALRDGITTLSQRCWKAFGPCIVLREAPWPSSTDLTVQGAHCAHSSRLSGLVLSTQQLQTVGIHQGCCK